MYQLKFIQIQPIFNSNITMKDFLPFLYPNFIEESIDPFTLICIVYITLISVFSIFAPVQFLVKYAQRKTYIEIKIAKQNVI